MFNHLPNELLLGIIHYLDESSLVALYETKNSRICRFLAFFMAIKHHNQSSLTWPVLHIRPGCSSGFIRLFQRYGWMFQRIYIHDYKAYLRVEPYISQDATLEVTNWENLGKEILKQVDFVTTSKTKRRIVNRTKISGISRLILNIGFGWNYVWSLFNALRRDKVSLKQLKLNDVMVENEHDAMHEHIMECICAYLTECAVTQFDLDFNLLYNMSAPIDIDPLLACIRESAQIRSISWTFIDAEVYHEYVGDILNAFVSLSNRLQLQHVTLGFYDGVQCLDLISDALPQLKTEQITLQLTVNFSEHIPLLNADRFIKALKSSPAKRIRCEVETQDTAIPLFLAEFPGALVTKEILGQESHPGTSFVFAIKD